MNQTKNLCIRIENFFLSTSKFENMNAYNSRKKRPSLEQYGLSLRTKDIANLSRPLKQIASCTRIIIIIMLIQKYIYIYIYIRAKSTLRKRERSIISKRHCPFMQSAAAAPDFFLYFFHRRRFHFFESFRAFLYSLFFSDITNGRRVLVSYYVAYNTVR